MATASDTMPAPNKDTVALREHVEALLAALEKRLDQRLDGVEQELQAAFLSAEKALDKAETAQAARNIVANEFREQLKDQAGTFLTRAEYEAKHETLILATNSLAERMNKQEGRAMGVSASWAALAAVLALLLTAAAILVDVFRRPP